MILNRSWRPALSITGNRRTAALESAGNVLRPYTRLQDLAAHSAAGRSGRRGAVVKETLEKDPPYGTRVAFEGEKASTDGTPAAGPVALVFRDRARELLRQAAMAIGEGGTIPFMGCWARSFRTRSSSSPRARARVQPRTARTSSCTSRPASG